ncbi:hypothetical protein Tco_0822929 [Tanacetum coccineum]|uniref:Uncharacterized protein n=1 Tax=Tanacetum coccineum TaxID=301880 RepID=A0ABQ5AGF9_9ASTR
MYSCYSTAIFQQSLSPDMQSSLNRYIDPIQNQAKVVNLMNVIALLIYQLLVNKRKYEGKKHNSHKKKRKYEERKKHDSDKKKRKYEERKKHKSDMKKRKNHKSNMKKRKYEESSYNRSE